MSTTACAAALRHANHENKNLAKHGLDRARPVAVGDTRTYRQKKAAIHRCWPVAKWCVAVAVPSPPAAHCPTVHSPHPLFGLLSSLTASLRSPFKRHLALFHFQLAPQLPRQRQGRAPPAPSPSRLSPPGPAPAIQ